ncbi:hypothetical protein [Nonomuraea sp. NPDC050783]|uniref:hypothetical protein n=1 Tax=Nonomuraea sp. NPDC050783 TaxID=3154634 RepID=UPI003467A8D8
MKALIAVSLLAPLFLGPGDGGAGDNVRAEAGQNRRTAFVNLAGSSIRISGDGAGRGSGDGYRIPRPCWYEPGPDAETMYRQQHDNPENARRTAIDEKSRTAFEKQFKDKLGQPGRWWTPAYNQADPNGAACWGDLELFLFVPPATTPPGGITIQQLAQIARAALTAPEPTVKLNPDAKSYVNLATWVWLEGIGQPRRTVTAEIPGVMSVTLVATLQNVRIDPGTTPDRAEVTESGCGAAGRPYTKGGTFSCGVRYLRSSIDRPGEKYTLTVDTVWPVQVQDNVVPFQFAPLQVGTSRDVPVGEIQSNVQPGEQGQ